MEKQYMSKRDAIKLDKKYEFYPEYDEEYGVWGVFGGETGCMYGEASNGEEAEEIASRMNQTFIKYRI